MSSDKIEIGKRITAIRKINGLTQENLAELLGCSVKHISHAERGLTYLSVDKYLFMSRYFHCSLDYLLKGVDGSDAASFLPAPLIEIMQNGSKREKELLLSYLSMYSKIKNAEDDLQQ